VLHRSFDSEVGLVIPFVSLKKLLACFGLTITLFDGVLHASEFVFQLNGWGNCRSLSGTFTSRRILGTCW
jgi:hypothetical protein